jgi:hypothetical protein
MMLCKKLLELKRLQQTNGKTDGGEGINLAYGLSEDDSDCDECDSEEFAGVLKEYESLGFDQE